MDCCIERVSLLFKGLAVSNEKGELSDLSLLRRILMPDSDLIHFQGDLLAFCSNAKNLLS